MNEQMILNLLERIHREVSEINWRMAKILDEVKNLNPQVVVYNGTTSQPLTSSEAVNEELRKVQA